jgi:two-component system OmpR family sensor kinase
MWSLRARLLLGLVVLAATGLLAAGYVTYREERSFLLGQVNAEVAGSFTTVEDQVDSLDHLRFAGAQPGPAPDRRGDGAGAGAAGLPGAPPREHQIDPVGTFGEHVTWTGQREGQPVAYDFKAQYEPLLPRDLASYVSRPGVPPHLFTVGAAGGTGVSYRLMVRPSDVGYGLTVVGVSLASTDASLARLEEIEAIVIGSVLAALALLAWLVIRIGLRPLDRIAATAGAIAAGDLSRRVSPAQQRTEVGRLGLALNAMLGQIEQAFAKRQQSEERLRRFLADASHELRTPLSSIRGYSELLRRGATGTREERAKAIERIEQEAARMGTLVEQLLSLARLDELPEGLREPVDLAPLVEDAAADARAAAPDRQVAVKATRGAHHVEGDPQELRQVLANIVGNALKHTPPGTPLELTLARHDGFERIEVRDHGSGLPAGGEAAVFERFWRAEGGRGRGKAGAGLGLAIVAEIVRAHGGRVSAGNARGGGASFVVELPVATAPSR